MPLSIVKRSTSPGFFSRPRIFAIVVWLGPVACVLGIVCAKLWRSLPWERALESLALACAALIPALLMRRLRGWRLAHSLAGIWLLALIYFAGVLPVMATAVLAATAVALGGLIAARRGVADIVIALPVGLAVIAGLLGWLLPVPVHVRLVYLGVALIICAARWRALKATGVQALRRFRHGVEAAPACAAVAVMLIGLASTGAWLPTMQSDDLAYHLALPTQLQRNGFYALDPSLQIWALAPWLGDVVHGVAQVIAAGEARGAVDAMWLVLAAAALARLAMELRAEARTAWLVVAVFASLPLLSSLLAGMQTELPATAMLAALALLVVQRRDQPGPAMFCVAVLAGGLVAMKLSQAVAALVMLVWLLARHRQAASGRRLMQSLLVFGVVGGASYFHAWRVSGNPMLPLFTGVFRSSVVPLHALVDARWQAGLDIALPWSITFDTSLYLESEPGGFGFALVVLGGAWLVAMCKASTRALALAASAVMLLPLLPLQYARYAFPGLALLLPAMIVAGDEVLGVRRFACIALALCALNLAFQANAPWPMSTVARKRLLTTGGDTGYVLRRFAPERVLIADLRRRDPSDSIVLALDGRAANVAELAGRGRTVAWYSPTLEAARIAADDDPSGARWQTLIADTNATWLLLRPDHLSEAQRAALRSGAATRVSAVGEAELWSWKRPTTTTTAPAPP